MTSSNEARAAIYTQFLDNWGATTASYCMDNEDFKPNGRAPWVRLTVMHTGGNQHTLGAKGQRKFRRNGKLFIQVFVRKGEGLLAADTVLVKAYELFEGVSLAGTTVCFTDARHREVGEDKNGWFAILFEADFAYEETK
jgi:hypothetical protein